MPARPDQPVGHHSVPQAAAPRPLSAARPRWHPLRRLSTRIVLVFLGLLLLVQASSFLGLRSQVQAKERAGITRQLDTASQALQTLLGHNAERLATSARITATEYGLRQAVHAQDGISPDADRQTLVDALQNNLHRMCQTAGPDGPARTERCRESAHAAVFDLELQPLAVTDEHAALATVALMIQPASSAGLCRRGGGVAQLAGHVVPQGGELMQYVLVPRCNPVLAGWVLMGFAVQDDLAADLHRITGVQLLALARPGPTSPWTTSVTTLPPTTAAALLQALGTASPGEHLATADEEFGTRPLALGTGPEGQAVALLALSLDEAMAGFRALQAVLLAITAAGVGLFAVGAALTARRITTPLRALARASERLGQGQFDEPIAIPAHRDEVGELALTVEHMRVGIRDRQAEIRRLAFRDRLTDLPNRASLADALREAVQRAQHEGVPFAVVVAGLDRFKLINETLGYAFGDRVLKAVSARLCRHVARQGDMVARLAGDQFALLLVGADEGRAQSVADGITAAFVQPLAINDHVVDVSATFGIACWPQHAPEIDPAAGLDADHPGHDSRGDILAARAEVAMVYAKKHTLGTLTYDPGIDAASVQTLSLLSDLRHAIAAGELRLFLQPKIDVASRQVVGAEALVRWQRGAELVPPMMFIPFAEDTGFVRQLTLWIFEETARQWRELSALGLQQVSVNLSTRDLLDPQLPLRLDAILRRHDAPSSAFCLEITESAIMSEPKRSMAMLLTLSMAGFKLSIDDYGEGQTSLSYLKRLPVHELKIDQIFIQRIDEDAKDAKIVRSTIALAHSLGFKVVAEGVESEAALQMLAQMQCDQAQGFHMSRPVPAAALPAFMVEWARRHGHPMPASLPAPAPRRAETAAPVAAAVASTAATAQSEPTQQPALVN